MSRIDRLKEQFPKYDVSIFDVIKILDPSNKNTYAEFLLKIISSKVNSRYDHVLESLYGVFTKECLSNLNRLETLYLYFILENFISKSDLDTLSKFEEYRNNGLIRSVDITKFTDFNDIRRFVSIAHLKSVDKSLEKQINIIYQDEEWLIIRPLTHVSSMKYGMGTKWCTTTYENPDYFDRYSRRGILIYTINKKTGLKVATFYSLEKFDKEFSFWDEKDNRIDSIESDLPFEILLKIKNEVKNNVISNRDLLSDTDKIKEDIYYLRYNNKKVLVTERVPVMTQVDDDYGVTYDNRNLNENQTIDNYFLVNANGDTFTTTNGAVTTTYNYIEESMS